MLDKLETRIPAGTEFASTFELGPDLRRGAVPGFKATKYYAAVGDLRPFGLDAILHLGYRHGEPNHKLELVSTGTRTFAQIASDLAYVWNTDPLNLPVMRADLAVDVSGIPVTWFREHARFKYKRFAARIDKAQAGCELEFVGMGTAVSQTLYTGRRPNLIRIYDKREEWHRQWRKAVRSAERFNRGLARFDFSPENLEAHTRTTPTFNEFCRSKGANVPPSPILTRIERQTGGNRIPAEIDTVGKLADLAEFDAFEGLEILASDAMEAPLPDVSRFAGSIRDYLEGVGFRALCRELGSVQMAVALITKYAKGNGRRVLESLRPFWPAADPDCRVTAEQIRNAFRVSVVRQFSGIAQPRRSACKQDDGSHSSEPIPPTLDRTAGILGCAPETIAAPP